ncbi:unnamed protein product, partial [Staurois parvus]
MSVLTEERSVLFTHRPFPFHCSTGSRCSTAVAANCGVGRVACARPLPRNAK